MITITTNLNAILPWDLIQQKVKEPAIKTSAMHRINNYTCKNASEKSLGTILQSYKKYFPIIYFKKH